MILYADSSLLTSRSPGKTKKPCFLSPRCRFARLVATGFQDFSYVPKNPVQEQADDEQAGIPGGAISLFFFPVMVIWT